MRKFAALFSKHRIRNSKNRLLIQDMYEGYLNDVPMSSHSTTLKKNSRSKKHCYDGFVFGRTLIYYIIHISIH